MVFLETLSRKLCSNSNYTVNHKKFTFFIFQTTPSKTTRDMNAKNYENRSVFNGVIYWQYTD